MNCPCGSGLAFDACCGPVIQSRSATTAEELMRSRYSAYVLGEIDYLLKTHDPATRDESKRESMTRWSKSTDWQGLTIVATERGLETDDGGVVEFIVRGATNDKPFELHERSRFRKVDGTWYYIDGTYHS